MLIKSVKIQLKYILKSKSAIFTFWLLILASSINFIENMQRNCKTIYVTEMFDIVKVLTLSDWTKVGYYLMQYYPILVVIPTSCVFLNDKISGIDIYISSRVGHRNYIWGKMISVFSGTFLIFTIPFITELLISCICFDVNSIGDPSGFEYWQTVENDGQYFLSNIYLYNRYIFAIIQIIIFGGVSAILAVFNFAVTTFSFVRYRLSTLFPVYALLYFIAMIEKSLNLKYTTYYAFVMRMFEVTKVKNYTIYGIFLGILLLVSFIILIIQIKRREYVNN